MSAPRYQAWRKRRGEFAFSRVEGCIADTKAEAYTLLMEMVELSGHQELSQELLILPEGEYPRAQTYSDRMMRPLI